MYLAEIQYLPHYSLRASQASSMSNVVIERLLDEKDLIKVEINQSESKNQ
jgi:hypothetical protein